ncbi:hypothetical protein DL89DRAFT_174003 [Linderina pennispora]|uniref:Uncharacterized protein n=1 Tax=Linderina pennispora TaxID=61395 RepID=A0A1Y1W7A9_9FUNG|nr:uncharacterized protein DL89DRAFT_174003 [Linderina pennispora]ORX69265.1 hypothetical protein DL89DRAFT_174003 [Linderina pennispora]
MAVLFRGSAWRLLIMGRGRGSSSGAGGGVLRIDRARSSTVWQKKQSQDVWHAHWHACSWLRQHSLSSHPRHFWQPMACGNSKVQVGDSKERFVCFACEELVNGQKRMYEGTRGELKAWRGGGALRFIYILKGPVRYPYKLRWGDQTAVCCDVFLFASSTALIVYQNSFLDAVCYILALEMRSGQTQQGFSLIW